mmetsp:Transcript_20641/g.50679  ORF Transcript_20641/g.50679 Transcript_20641/m.50679 type:complete len:539 (+) Transcript_20641:475-2091(+)
MHLHSTSPVTGLWGWNIVLHLELLLGCALLRRIIWLLLLRSRFAFSSLCWCRFSSSYGLFSSWSGSWSGFGVLRLWGLHWGHLRIHRLILRSVAHSLELRIHHWHHSWLSHWTRVHVVRRLHGWCMHLRIWISMLRLGCWGSKVAASAWRKRFRRGVECESLCVGIKFRFGFWLFLFCFSILGLFLFGLAGLFRFFSLSFILFLFNRLFFFNFGVLFFCWSLFLFIRFSRGVSGSRFCLGLIISWLLCFDKARWNRLLCRLCLGCGSSIIHLWSSSLCCIVSLLSILCEHSRVSILFVKVSFNRLTTFFSNVNIRTGGTFNLLSEPLSFGKLLCINLRFIQLGCVEILIVTSLDIEEFFVCFELIPLSDSSLQASLGASSSKGSASHSTLIVIQRTSEIPSSFATRSPCAAGRHQIVVFVIFGTRNLCIRNDIVLCIGSSESSSISSWAIQTDILCMDVNDFLNWDDNCASIFDWFLSIGGRFRNSDRLKGVFVFQFSFQTGKWGKRVEYTFQNTAICLRQDHILTNQCKSQMKQTIP